MGCKAWSHSRRCHTSGSDIPSNCSLSEPTSLACLYTEPWFRPFILLLLVRDARLPHNRCIIWSICLFVYGLNWVAHCEKVDRENIAGRQAQISVRQKRCCCGGMGCRRIRNGLGWIRKPAGIGVGRGRCLAAGGDRGFS